MVIPRQEESSIRMSTYFGILSTIRNVILKPSYGKRAGHLDVACTQDIGGDVWPSRPNSHCVLQSVEH